MKSEFWGKIILSVVMWVTLVALSFGVVFFGMDMLGDSPMLVVLLLTPIILAFIGTGLIWNSMSIGTSGSAVTAHPRDDQFPQKSKRESGSLREERLALLVDLLDDEELAAFKETLKRRVVEDTAQGDDELPYFDESLGAWSDER